MKNEINASAAQIELQRRRSVRTKAQIFMVHFKATAPFFLLLNKQLPELPSNCDRYGEEALPVQKKPPCRRVKEMTTAT